MKKTLAALMLLFAGFFATAEIIEKGNDTFIIMNESFCSEYYCGEEGKVFENKEQMDYFVKLLVDEWGLPDVYISDNKELDSEVAKITKKHGFSMTGTGLGTGIFCEYLVNVYYKGTFRFYGWR